MNPGRIILYIICAILFGLFWVTGGDEIRDYLPYYGQRFIGRSATVRVGDQTIYAEVARSAKAQAHGLSERHKLPKQKGMLFPFHEPGTYTFWMNEMHLAIDIVWIRDGRIVDVSRNLQPPAVGKEPMQARPPSPVTEVLEVVNGAAASWRPGDTISIKDDKPLFLP